MSQVVEITLPDELPATLQRDLGELGEELRLAAAVKWYEMGLLSQGKAAEVADLSRAAFINQLARFGVSPFPETASDVIEAVRHWTSSYSQKSLLRFVREFVDHLVPPAPSHVVNLGLGAPVEGALLAERDHGQWQVDTALPERQSVEADIEKRVQISHETRRSGVFSFTVLC